MLRRLLLLILCASVMYSCDVHLVNTTPASSTIGYSQTYPISADISADFFVIPSTIRVTALAFDSEFPLDGHGEGNWSVGVPILCKWNDFNYMYRIEWKYLALIIPVAESKVVPESGEFNAVFPPLPILDAPSEILCYSVNETYDRDVRVTSQALDTLIVLDVRTAPAGSDNCYFGDCSGSAFLLESVPDLPAMLTCGQDFTFRLVFGSTRQSSGRLIITTNQGTVIIELEGKIFLI